MDKLREMQEAYDKYKSLKNEVPLAVSVIVLNSDNKVLGVSRKDNHSDFGLAGGKVDSEDKDVLDATIRELYEETGLLFEREKFIKIYQGSHMNYWQTTYFVNVISDMDDSVFNYDEPHIVKWVDWKDIFDGSFGKYNRIVYTKLQELLVCLK